MRRKPQRPEIKSASFPNTSKRIICESSEYNLCSIKHIILAFNPWMNFRMKQIIFYQQSSKKDLTSLQQPFEIDYITILKICCFKNPTKHGIVKPIELTSPPDIVGPRRPLEPSRNNRSRSARHKSNGTKMWRRDSSQYHCEERSHYSRSFIRWYGGARAEDLAGRNITADFTEYLQWYLH